MKSDQTLKILSRAFVVACSLGGVTEAQAKSHVRHSQPHHIHHSHTGHVICSPVPVQSGRATFYGTNSDHYAGKQTASGEWLTPDAMTAASNTFPMGTTLKVVWPDNGRHILVDVNDTGGFNNPRHLTKKSTVIDLNYGAGKALGMIGPGNVAVDLYKCHY